jgi:hypothetical protein
MTNTACILWLGGSDPELFGEVAAVRELAERGIDTHLAPLPLVEPGTCYYQTLAALESGKTGRFDGVRPVDYMVEEEAGVPEGVWQRLLPDLVRRGGRAVTFLEQGVAETRLALGGVAGDCVVLRVDAAGRMSVDAIEALVRQCETLVGRDGHLVVLTDVATPAPARIVSVNDFLAETGLLETRGGAGAGREITWSDTLAYGLGTGQVWINLCGREPEGVVNPGREYDEVCEVLGATLRDDWRDPATGEPVVERVLRKGEAFTGEYLFKAPDLIVIYRPGYGTQPQTGRIELGGATIRPGPGDGRCQAPSARLVAGGPAFARHVSVPGRLIDVVPSVLYLLGLPIPAHVDGQVVPEWFSPEYRAWAPIVRAEEDEAPLTGEEEGAIVDRLQALGYLG